MFSKLILFLIMKQIFYINNYIVLPIYTLKRENYISPYELNSVKDIISTEFCSSLYTELEIGNPPQKIPLLVKMKTNDYVVTSIHPMIKNGSDYFKNKALYDFSENFMKNYNYFNENKSTTFSSKYCENRARKYRYDYDYPVAEETCSSYDSFYFYENIKMKNKIKENNLYFDIVRNIKDNITGIIGLSLHGLDFRESSSFLSILKKKNLTENYYWFFDFNSPKDDKGKLIIGTTLDIIDKKKYGNKILNHSPGQGYNFWHITFNKVYIKDSSKTIDLSTHTADLKFESNVISVPYEYREYFKEIMKDLYTNGTCFNDTFEGCSDFYNYGGNWTFAYCKNEKKVKNELNKIIKPIYFFSSDLNYTFELNINDILKESGDYIFIKILFQRYGGDWGLGRPFSIKYKFMLNPDIKEIGFYSQDIEKKKSYKSLILVLIIILLCVIFAVLGVVVGKILFGLKRKKRANELNDDDYEYFAEKDKKEEDRFTNEENKNDNSKNNYNTIN